MLENEKEEILVNAIFNIVDYHVTEYKFTINQIVGILDTIKASYQNQAFEGLKEGDEDNDEL